MAEKKKWAPTKMFLQWCLSYLLISVIALTLLLASGYRYLDVLRDNLEYTNGIQLDMTRVWLDQKVKLLRNITAKESSTAAIEAVRQADDYDDIPRYDYYMLTRKISTDVINYGIGDAYFLYFPSTDAIVSNTKYGQSRRFYDLVLEAYDISYEDWMEILKQNLVTTRVFQPVVQGKDSKNYLVLMRPLNITSREPDKAVAVMIVDLEDLFKASDWLNNDTLCINDRNNGVLVANHELPEATENAVTELIKSSGSRKFDEAAHHQLLRHSIELMKKTVPNMPIMAKLAIESTDALTSMRIAEAAGAAAAGPTARWKGYYMDIDWRGTEARPGAGYGGTQATPLVCYSIAEARTAGVKLPLYGGGGVFNYENAARILMAGSEMVQLGALACAGGTMACKKLISDLNSWMDENGYADMDSLVGDSLKLFQMDADFTKKRQNKLADAYQTADADRTKCIGCGRCEDVCWHQGIEIKERKAYKTDKCIGCGYCFQVCPTQALYVDKKGILRSAFEEAGIRRGNK